MGILILIRRMLMRKGGFKYMRYGLSTQKATTSFYTIPQNAQNSIDDYNIKCKIANDLSDNLTKNFESSLRLLVKSILSSASKVGKQHE